MFYVSCGLAVLAMTAQPLLTCEAPLYGSTNSAGDAMNGAEDVTINEEAVNNAHRQARSNNVFPFDYIVPTLNDYQTEAINAGYTNRGEMFSARVMAQLASHFRPSQYHIQLVKEDLIAPETPTPSPTKKRHCYKVYSDDGNSTEGSSRAVKEDDNDEGQTESSESSDSEVSTKLMATSSRRIKHNLKNSKIHNRMHPNMGIIGEYYSNDRDKFSPFMWKLECKLPLPANRYTPIRLVQRLMRGDLIAVW